MALRRISRAGRPLDGATEARLAGPRSRRRLEHLARQSDEAADGIAAEIFDRDLLADLQIQTNRVADFAHVQLGIVQQGGRHGRVQGDHDADVFQFGYGRLVDGAEFELRFALLAHHFIDHLESFVQRVLIGREQRECHLVHARDLRVP